tara:strand:- start:218 stop:565 length:348 start_codon:yes stop_codon:yes gene_type:complete
MFSCSVDDCRLSDGKYKIIYDREFSGHQIEVKSDTIKEIYQDNSVISVIEWISDKDFFLSDLVSHLTYKDDLKKDLYTYDRPFYRLINCRKDTIDFKLMRNKNDQVNSGKLIKTE